MTKTVAPLDPALAARIAAVPALTLDALARLIAADWKATSKNGVYFGAVPYLDAMRTMPDVSTPYFADSGPSVVRYFLANATTWRGPYAKAVKADLNKRIANKW